MHCNGVLTIKSSLVYTNIISKGISPPEDGEKNHLAASPPILNMFYIMQKECFSISIA